MSLSATAITAVATDGQGNAATHTINLSRAASATPQYDLNGNLLGDGCRSFTYDAENQLAGIVVSNSPANSTQTGFVYDGHQRRRIRTEAIWQSGAWLTNQVVRYLYDGNRVIQERDGDNNVLVSYTRGLDLSLSLEGAGGIGGLLARTHPGNHHFFYHSDIGGNVTAIMNENQTLVAQYRYDPFGNLLAATGPLAEANLYRFSGKEFHPASGLYYYGYRFYDPNLQRWLNRDPIEKQGGVNHYRFVKNEPINNVDPLGLLTTHTKYMTTDTYFADVFAQVFDDRADPVAQGEQFMAVEPIPARNVLAVLMPAEELTEKRPLTAQERRGGPIPTPAGPPPIRAAPLARSFQAADLHGALRRCLPRAALPALAPTGREAALRIAIPNRLVSTTCWMEHLFTS